MDDLVQKQIEKLSGEIASLEQVKNQYIKDGNRVAEQRVKRTIKTKQDLLRKLEGK